MINFGSLILSLDYELMWGCCEWSTPEKYGKSNVANVHFVIERMLNLFEKYDVKATFATVGLIMHENKKEALDNLPSIFPSYINKKCSPYRDNYIRDINDIFTDMYFDVKMVKKLSMISNIEISTHTYSHYYCWEKGQTIKEFEADIVNAIRVAKNLGIEITSIVFPKNMVSDDYLKVCKQKGINVYRGNSLKFFNKPNSKLGLLKNRILRFLDSYINIGGNTSIPYSFVHENSGVLNVPASRMLRPYSPRLSLFEWLRLRRIRNEIIYAAKHNEIYHLWWHPHNFGSNIEKNIHFLEEVLKCYRYCNETYNMKSFKMSEIVNIIKK